MVIKHPTAKGERKTGRVKDSFAEISLSEKIPINSIRTRTYFTVKMYDICNRTRIDPLLSIEVVQNFECNQNINYIKQKVHNLKEQIRFERKVIT